MGIRRVYCRVEETHGRPGIDGDTPRTGVLDQFRRKAKLLEEGAINIKQVHLCGRAMRRKYFTYVNKCAAASSLQKIKPLRLGGLSLRGQCMNFGTSKAVAHRAFTQAISPDIREAFLKFQSPAEQQLRRLKVEDEAQFHSLVAEADGGALAYFGELVAGAKTRHRKKLLKENRAVLCQEFSSMITCIALSRRKAAIRGKAIARRLVRALSARKRMVALRKGMKKGRPTGSIKGRARKTELLAAESSFARGNKKDPRAKESKASEAESGALHHGKVDLLELSTAAASNEPKNYVLTKIGLGNKGDAKAGKKKTKIGKRNDEKINKLAAKIVAKLVAKIALRVKHSQRSRRSREGAGAARAAAEKASDRLEVGDGLDAAMVVKKGTSASAIDEQVGGCANSCGMMQLQIGEEREKIRPEKRRAPTSTLVLRDENAAGSSKISFISEKKSVPTPPSQPQDPGLQPVAVILAEHYKKRSACLTFHHVASFDQDPVPASSLSFVLSGSSLVPKMPVSATSRHCQPDSKMLVASAKQMKDPALLKLDVPVVKDEALIPPIKLEKMSQNVVFSFPVDEIGCSIPIVGDEEKEQDCSPTTKALIPPIKDDMDKDIQENKPPDQPVLLAPNDCDKRTKPDQKADLPISTDRVDRSRILEDRNADRRADADDQKVFSCRYSQLPPPVPGRVFWRLRTPPHPPRSPRSRDRAPARLPLGGRRGSRRFRDGKLVPGRPRENCCSRRRRVDRETPSETRNRWYPRKP
ncbi:unnamed protein product [Amoebophrya sp. A120]|nr:unnamed protein product [Amoebophrya sp. A120]|eukprot:GSA120T00023989001.1